MSPPLRSLSSSPLSTFTLVALALCAIPGAAGAQIAGQITTPATAVGRPVLDPNGDSFVSKTTAGFATDDVAESEVPYYPLPLYGAEPSGDTRTGASGGVTDLVDTTPTKQALMVFYDRGPDTAADTFDDRLLFRMRLGKDPGSGAYGYSVLIDTDGKFGTTGAGADPNAVSGNPGFEIEIILATGGSAKGLNVSDVDGRTSGVLRATYPIGDYSQHAVALTTTDNNPDAFLDFFIPFSILKTHFNVTSTTRLRFIGASSSSPSSALGGSASDVGGVPDNQPAFQDGDAAFVTAVSAAPATTFGNLGAGGSGFDTTPPDTTIASGPGPVVGSATATFSLASDETGATFECSLDGAAFAPCPASVSLSGLSHGEHQFRARAVDAAGNADASPATWSWTVDRNAPAAPVISSPAPNATVATLTPTVSGTAEAGSTVTVTIDGSLVGTAVAAADGSWSVSVVSPLGLGSHTVAATATDPAGNTATSPPQAFQVAFPRPDTTITSGPPQLAAADSASFAFESASTGAIFECRVDGAAFAPCSSPKVLTALEDGPHTFEVRARDGYGQEDLSPASWSWTVDTLAPAAPVISSPAAGSSTADSRPTLQGTAEPNSEVTVSIDGVEVGKARADASGSWSLGLTSSLSEAAHVAVAVSKDEAGNRSQPSSPVPFTVDVSAPDTRVASGPKAPSNSTTARFTFASTESDATFECSLDGGAWAACPASAEWGSLSQGSHTLEVRARDAAGNTDPTPATWSWSIDASAPEAPVIAAPIAGAVVADDTPQVSGTAEPGSTVTVSVDGVAVGTAVASAAGQWSLSPSEPLAPGPHTATATSTDAAGNASPASAPVGFSVDTSALDTNLDSAPAALSNSGSATFAFSSSKQGASFECRLDGGTWEPCASPASFASLEDGPHTFEVRAVLGQDVDASPAIHRWTVDARAPEAPAILTPEDGAAIASSTPAIAGTAEPGALVTVSVDGVQAGTALADSSGRWTFTPSASLEDGPHSVTATAQDGAGNASPSSAASTFTVDTAAPSTAIVSGPAPLSATRQGSFDLSSDEPGATFECSLDGGTYLPCQDPAAFAGLSDGQHTLAARARDAAGNVDGSPATWTWTVDATAPAAPFIERPSSGDVVASLTPAVSGEAEPGSVVTVLIDGVVVGTAVADEHGAWSVTPDKPLAPGPHAVTATATDAAGNESGARPSAIFVVDPDAVDTTLVSAPRGSTTQTSATLAFTSNLEGAAFECRLDGAAWAGCSSPTTVEGLADGEHLFEVRAVVAGVPDRSPAAALWHVDTRPPPPPSITSPEDGATVSSGQPTLTGTAEPGSTVTVTADGEVIGSAVAGPDGRWSLTPAEPLAQGAHALSATAEDAAGNGSAASETTDLVVDPLGVDTLILSGPPAVVSSASGTFDFDSNRAGATFSCNLDGAGWQPCPDPATFAGLAEGEHALSVRARAPDGAQDPSPAIWRWRVDATPPAPPVVERPQDGAVMEDSVPVFRGTAEPGSQVTVYVDGEAVGAATADEAGQWSVPATEPLSEGPHQVTAAATDSAGNAGQASAPSTFTVNADPPETTIADGPPPSDPSPDAAFAFESDSEGASFECALDGAPWTPCPSAWTAKGLSEGPHALFVRAVDDSGSADPSPASWKWTVDLTSPPAPAVTGPTGTQATGTPAIFGTAEPGATVVVSVDGVVIGSAQAAEDGTWSLTPPAPLTEGPHQLTASCSDAAGNESPASAPASVVVDTTAPDTGVAGPSGLTGESTATFAFSSDEGGVAYQCSLDGGPFAPCPADGRFTGLSDGPHTLSVRATDPAGNTDPTPAAASWTVDTSAPAKPVVTSPAGGSTTDDPTPTVAGTAEPGSEVDVYVDGKLAGTAKADASGNWSLELEAPLGDGQHTVTARATDAAGNESAASAPVSFTVSTARPASPTVTSPADGGITADSTPTVSGTAPAGSTVTVYVDGEEAGTAVAGADGSWTLELKEPLGDGEHTITATAAEGGKPSEPSAPVSVTVDTTAPDGTVTTNPDGSPSGFQCSEDGCRFECRLDGGDWRPCDQVDLLGLPDGEHSLEVRASDPAGNSDATPTTVKWSVQPLEQSFRGGGLGCSSGGGASPWPLLGLLGLLPLRRRRLARAAAVAALASLPLAASAQTLLPAFELERLELNPSGHGGLAVGGGETLPEKQLRLSLAAHYEREPLVYYRDGAPVASVVSGRLTAHLMAAWAPLHWLELDLQIPFIPYQWGDELPANLSGAASGTGIGTPTLSGRARLLSRERGAPFDLAFQLGIRPPIGSASLLALDDGLGATARLGASRRFGLLAASADVGTLLRPAVKIGGGTRPVMEELGSLLDASAGLATTNEGLRGELAVRGAVPFSSSPSSLEILLGGRLPFGDGLEAFALAGPGIGQTPGTPSFRALLGLAFAPVEACKKGSPHDPEKCPVLDLDGDGVANAQDACPGLAGKVELAGCPDRDGDRVADGRDLCPTVAGLDRLQGCPVPDGDGDGLDDEQDACPREAGLSELSGCPKPDADRDGLPDESDRCPSAAGKASLRGCPDGDEDGLADLDDACPTEPGQAVHKGCPDPDQDGLAGADDACPREAGIVELKGCPAKDGDADGVADHVDNCLKEAGPASNQGCPEARKQLVVLTQKKIEILDKVYFATGKSTIMPKSFGLLTQVADVLQQHPEIARVSVEGHTDNTGKADANRKLSQARAEAVRAFLQKKGVAAGRLDAKGFGPDRPADTNDTAPGREKNRRVEFVIVDP